MAQLSNSLLPYLFSHSSNQMEPSAVPSARVSHKVDAGFGTVEIRKPHFSFLNNDMVASSDITLSMGIRVRKTDFSVSFIPTPSPATSLANRVLRLPVREE